MTVDFEKLDKRWLALQVRTGWEVKSAADLRSKGYEEFVPMVREKRQWSDRVKTIETPLFTSYVFVRFDVRNPLRIMSVPGAIRFVSSGVRPVPVEDAEIESLRILREAGVSVQPCEFLEVGQQVRIGRGALHGLQGSIARVKNRDRIVVSVTLLKRSVFVELDSCDVSGAIPVSHAT